MTPSIIDIGALVPSVLDVTLSFSSPLVQPLFDASNIAPLYVGSPTLLYAMMPTEESSVDVTVRYRMSGMFVFLVHTYE